MIMKPSTPNSSQSRHVRQPLPRTGFGHAGEHRNPAARNFDAQLDDFAFFSRIERLIFTQRAAHDETADAGIDQCLQVLRGGVEIDRFIFVKLRGDGGENALPMGVHGEPVV